VKWIPSPVLTLYSQVSVFPRVPGPSLCRTQASDPTLFLTDFPPQGSTQLSFSTHIFSLLYLLPLKSSCPLLYSPPFKSLLCLGLSPRLNMSRRPRDGSSSPHNSLKVDVPFPQADVWYIPPVSLSPLAGTPGLSKRDISSLSSCFGSCIYGPGEWTPGLDFSLRVSPLSFKSIPFFSPPLHDSLCRISTAFVARLFPPFFDGQC